MPKRATSRRILEASAVGAFASLTGRTELQKSLVETTQSTDETRRTVTTETPADDQAVQRVGEPIRPAVVSIDTRTSSSGGSGGMSDSRS